MNIFVNFICFENGLIFWLVDVRALDYIDAHLLSSWTHSNPALKTCCAHEMRMYSSRLVGSTVQCTLVIATLSGHCQPVTVAPCPLLHQAFAH